MKFAQTALPGVLLIEPSVFGDERGYFMEAFHAERFCDEVDRNVRFVQDNQSLSRQGVLRGLHYQIGAHPQGKLVRAISGEIYDVAVDIRRESPHFGQWFGAHLTAENKRQMWVPAGFAHGFLVTSASAEVLYKVSDIYDPDGERAIRWDDPAIGIKWPLPGGAAPQLSAKDAVAGLLADAEVF